MSFNFPFDEMHVIVFTLISLLVGVLVPLTSGRNKTKYDWILKFNNKSYIMWLSD